MDNVRAVSDGQNQGRSRSPGIRFHEVKKIEYVLGDRKGKNWKAVLKLGSGKVGAEK